MRPFVASLCAVLSGLAAPSAAQVSPNGPQFQVNTLTTWDQEAPAVAAAPDGGFVAVWHFQYGAPGFETGVRLRRYDPRGVPLGDEQAVNTEPGGSDAAVATDAAGAFVVAWTSLYASGGDGFWSIDARRFDGSGLPLGAEFQVNTYATSFQSAPDVAVAPGGGFVVAWESDGSAGSDTSERSVQAQRFDPGGLPLGPEFQVNTFTTGYQQSPSVAVSAAGEFVVAWESFDVQYPGFFSRIDARRFAADGTSLGPEFQVDTYTSGFRSEPAVAFAPGGGFVVAWTSYGSFGTDASGWSVQVRRFDADGTPLGAELQVNTYTTGDQRAPRVAADSRGDFLVVWQSAGSDGTDTSSSSVQARRFDAESAPLGGELQVNTYTTNAQDAAALAVDPLGNFVVLWQSDGSSGTDQDRRSVQGQRYDQLFRDGFESGDAGRWSAAGP